MSVLQKKHPLKTLNGNRLLAAYGSLSLRPNNGKRKSAVEMLQETKAFYVKSERVLDSKQEMKHADHLQVTAAPLCRAPWPPRPYSEPPPEPAPPAPPPPPPRPAALPPRLTPEKPPWKTPEKGVRGAADKPPPLPARSPGCAGPGRACRLLRGEPTVPERRRSGDSVQARLRQLLSPAARPPSDSGRHKSLPDISADSSSASADSGGASETGRQSRSDARSRGRATSDYVSRSPGSALTPSDGRRDRRDAYTDDGRARADTEAWPHRPVTRSKSDVSHRYGRGAAGGGALGLWTAEPPPPLPARGARRCSTELGRFFDQLGMDGERFGHLARVPSDHWSPLETPSFWDGLSESSRSRGRRTSVASEASSAAAAARRRDGGGLRLLPPAVAEPSIVEKNARIVKWLFQCRRARDEWTLGVT
ncbi:protein FAM110A-like [Amphibalanus amphitrite]|uniref:protein FAM110A-like n=1 Tax=Amphibalanus amphitrite TaxID=1232801 RepID=UPI001C901732|nr:protein FAM110A-like [Amphibalanus amphitrite]